MRRNNIRQKGAGLLLSAGVMMAGSAHAAGPRWVTGPPYFSGQGAPVLWGNWAPHYFTDPGDLSPSVDHAAADKIVAAAMNVWNVPTSGITVSYGGALDEHVGTSNTYLTANGPVFPPDVRGGPGSGKDIAIIYDVDGSVTDMLLGGGASGVAECRQNGVTESVDSIDTSGYIRHAILILNGRCTGPAPEQQLQLQYQLQRAFGRVLGLGWSQTNDNVFTGTPTPSYVQEMHWPILHPIDIVCGPYTYQCLPEPFTLRDDDLASISSLYAMRIFYQHPSTPPAPGKIWTFDQASAVYGHVTFPSGQGMQGVNVQARRLEGGHRIPETFYDVSSVSGYLYQRDAGSPVTGASKQLSASMGSTDSQWEGYYEIGWLPEIDPVAPGTTPMQAYVTMEPLNPLYIGSHAVGPYTTGAVTPSGTSPNILTQYYLVPVFYPWNPVEVAMDPPDAASNCAAGGDGTESSPATVPAGGWWTGTVCTHGHTAWSSFTAKAGRTATVEMKALDEAGLATVEKAIPVIGMWNASDAPGSAPTVAATPSAFNTTTLGMTAAGASVARAGALRLALTDARGDGRPDFAYQARLLYADTVQPSLTSANGGPITITGMGFRAGNEVLVNGVQAAVSSWTATTITAIAPPVTAFATLPGTPVDVAVIDVSTGGSTVMTAALTYGAVLPDVLLLVSGPSGTIATGTPATPPFAVRVLLGDGVTPVAGVPVTFTANGAAVLFNGCAATPCVVMTDASGLAAIGVTPAAFGSVTLQAAAVGATQTVIFNAVERHLSALRPVEYVAAGALVSWTPQVSVEENGATAPGITVNWTGSAGIAISPGSSAGNGAGLASVTAAVGPLAASVQAAGQGCAWTGTGTGAVCANFTAVGVDPADWRLVVVSGAGQKIALGTAFSPVTVMVTDAAGHPVAGAPVAVHQTMDAAEMPCPVRGRCPVAPVLGDSETAGISDIDGLVTVKPLESAGAGEVTNLVVATGTQGFVSLSMTQGP